MHIADCIHGFPPSACKGSNSVINPAGRRVKASTGPLPAGATITTIALNYVLGHGLVSSSIKRCTELGQRDVGVFENPITVSKLTHTHAHNDWLSMILLLVSRDNSLDESKCCLFAVILVDFLGRRHVCKRPFACRPAPARHVAKRYVVNYVAGRPRAPCKEENFALKDAGCVRKCFVSNNSGKMENNSSTRESNPLHSIYVIKCLKGKG